WRPPPVSRRPDRASPRHRPARFCGAPRRAARRLHPAMVNHPLNDLAPGSRNPFSMFQILASLPNRFSDARPRVPPTGGGTSMHRNIMPGGGSRKRVFPRLSIRARLMLLALLAVVPLTLDRVRLLEASRAERTEMAANEALELAKRGAAAQLEMINSTRAVLEGVARGYIALARNRQSCIEFLAAFTNAAPSIRSLPVAGEPAHIPCPTRA